MKKLILLSVVALLVAVASALSVRRDWALDTGILVAFWAALAIIATLAVNSVMARRRGAGQSGPFGPGLLTVAQTFWTTMAINIGVGYLMKRLDEAAYRPESYAIGLGAFATYAIVALAVLVCSIFALVRWWPLRLFLATASGCTAAFACMAVTWWR